MSKKEKEEKTKLFNSVTVETKFINEEKTQFSFFSWCNSDLNVAIL